MRGTCAAKDCPRDAKPRQLMCWPHWKRVPRTIQDAIWSTVHELGDDYEHARSAAIRVVHIKEDSSNLRPGDKTLLAWYGIGIDGYPEKVSA